MRFLPCGDRAVLVECDSQSAVLGLHGALAASRPPGIIELVPAARTVLVVVKPRVIALETTRTWIERAAQGGTPERRADAGSPVVVIDTVYDGDDLAPLADILGVSAREIVERHTAAEWDVAFSGFAPGFAYLVSADWPFDVPRLDSPRTRVPRGSVALAADFSGVYPRESPGGWQLIGRTDAELWNDTADPPALLVPGGRVRFREVAP
ncbi:5-oxoprolinase subunit B family protein [Agromyces atrinae]|uniref:Allophanate hydrolase subunit 1 n=1 Tax=Agromyces atrinae TaxID=592376 RepID=A0A4Q2M6F2_9MICO|nr:allophanate hydrolase subunit 1 [Agromyces atrinae]NYD66913.1 KipI family sensor histidine kinase inhibitor [Agromyces atrinae]RXZ87559.1 allophanate hydrolase subunit 1 [Agromyces atrinae]